jgi:sugar phosphate isomerase/epimerase
MQKNEALAVRETVSLVDAYVANQKDVSVHLPVCMPKGYPYGPFEVFFLDDDLEKRTSSFELLRTNLELFQGKKLAFYVIHFAGVYCDEASEHFLRKCERVLTQINQMAQAFKVTILLEYFGLNSNLYKPLDWKIITKYSNLGVLVDTGHLYFASKMHGFDFYDALQEMSSFASAYHLWNTGEEEGVYQSSKSYVEKHHMPPLLSQTRGLAIDFKRIGKLLLETQKPLIIEASLNDGGLEKIISALNEWVAYEQTTP